MQYTLRVNGATHQVQAEPTENLLSVLRDDLGLTGSKYGCGEGQCGACTVLLDGRAARSCVTRVSAAASRPVITIEGLAEGERLHPVQQAFLEAEALQCGYCTPGMIMAAVGLLRTTASPSDEEISRAMHGNVCRCGAYSRIVQAIRLAADRMRPAASAGAAR